MKREHYIIELSPRASLTQRDRFVSGRMTMA